MGTNADSRRTPMAFCQKCCSELHGTAAERKAAARKAEGMKELETWAEDADVRLCRGGEWTQDMVLDALAESADKLIPILKKLRKS